MSAAVICLRLSHSPNVWTKWPTAEAAVAQLQKCTPACGPDCIGVHVLAWSDERGTHVRSDPVRRLPLAQELALLYRRPHHHNQLPPEQWPADPELNEDFQRQRAGSGASERFTRR